jgi:hypothetical protein
MLINATVFVPFPLALVYSTYRDCLPELVKPMSSVKQVLLKSRQEVNGAMQQAYEWHGKSEIPGMLKAFLSEDLLVWTDFATWKESEHVTNWQIRAKIDIWPKVKAQGLKAEVNSPSTPSSSRVCLVFWLSK